MNSFPFLDSITQFPIASNLADVARFSERYHEQAEQQPQSTKDALYAIYRHASGKCLLDGVFGNSPYLASLILKDMRFFVRLCSSDIRTLKDSVLQQVREVPLADAETVMKALRIYKRRIALLTALTEITAHWYWPEITGTLSDFASAALGVTTDYLLKSAHDRGEIMLSSPDTPSVNSGFIVLAMGKLGAGELNYSSDIDLILLFDREKITYSGKQDIQRFFTKLAHELVRIMQERTADGYVFRTDLRLRPDPNSTPPVLSVNGAVTYYETVGQNWERAALIKARGVAGDIDAARQFLKHITPFIWRKHLDFAAIADIHSIKRQIDSHKQNKLSITGHNIKLGIGGIREIEFFAQIHQLIWGGRMPALRTLTTCGTLEALVTAGLLETKVMQFLSEAYAFYRRIEHHLQMQNDEQTHSLPVTPEALQHIAQFLGFAEYQAFEQKLLGYLHKVHEIFITHFAPEDSLSAEGSLVFTGVENDPDTLKTIEQMGYKHPARVSEIIQSWHRGSRRATRTKRARELITELTPRLLKSLAETANPDDAFLRFDEFLGTLPAGVQLFSLFTNNPALIELIADIMGSAPAIADSLSRNPALLDSVLTAGFYDAFPDKQTLQAQLGIDLNHARNEEDALQIIRRFKNEKTFQAGIQLFKNQFNADRVGVLLSDIAEIVLDAMLTHVYGQFISSYGDLPDSNMAVIALGKLGARELTFGSDLDIIFVYAVPEGDALSTGERSFPASVYYNRLVQRYINQLTVTDKGGRLYEIDTRLRPSGADGPLAVNLAAFDKYLSESVWTFELMALTRARVVVGNPAIKQSIASLLHTHLTKKRDAQKIRSDVYEMRKKIDTEHHSTLCWNTKYVRGGLIDIDFIAQYLLLTHAHAAPEILQPSSPQVFAAAVNAGIMDDALAHMLTTAYTLQSHLLSYLRLCQVSQTTDPTSERGLATLLAEAFGEADILALKATLERTQHLVYTEFERLLYPSQLNSWDGYRERSD